MHDSAQAVSIKAPPFMENAVPSWFVIIEAQFKVRRISEESTKFYHALSALPPNVVASLPLDSINNEKYSQLKDEVVAHFENSKPELFNKLITSTQVAGRPSQYLRELRSIAQKVGVGDELPRHRFIQSLPSSIAPVLASQKDLSLDQLGRLADELQPLSLQNQSFLATAEEKIIPKPANVQRPARSNSPAIPIGVRPFGNSQRPLVCRAHIYFADRARTCKPWCKWPNKRNNNLQMQPSSRPSSPTPSLEN